MFDARRRRNCAAGHKRPRRRICSSATAVEWILRVDQRTHCRCFGPVWMGLTDTFLEFARNVFERLRTLAIVVNLQQLQGNFVAALVPGESLFEDFFSLRVTAISDIDISLGKRINFIGIDAAWTSLVEVSQERAITGINQTATFIAGNGIRL